MSADSLLQAGDRAFVEEDYDLAASRYQEAVAQAPTSAACEAEASEAANKAISIDASNAKAYLRRG
jgi:hypothetical protein